MTGPDRSPACRGRLVEERNDGGCQRRVAEDGVVLQTRQTGPHRLADGLLLISIPGCSQIGNRQPQARGMHVITRKRLREFGALHPAAVTPLDDCFRIMEASRFEQPSEVKEVLGQTDFIEGSLAVFDIGGNKFRVVADVVFRYQIVLLREVFTHKEYDAWSKARRKGR